MSQRTMHAHLACHQDLPAPNPDDGDQVHFETGISAPCDVCKEPIRPFDQAVTVWYPCYA